MITQAQSYQPTFVFREQTEEDTTRFVTGSGRIVSAIFQDSSRILAAAMNAVLSSSNARSHILDVLKLSSWKLVQPILLNITIEDNAYIVNDDLFFVYGNGDSLTAALRDYEASLVEYYQIIVEHLQRNTANQPLFDRIRQYIQPV